MPLHDRSDIAGSQPAFGHVAGQDHVAVHVEGLNLPRIHGNESRHLGASVNLPDRAEADGPAVGRLDRALDLVDDAIRILMCAGHIERKVLTFAQIDRHTEAVDELDVQGILAFAERILPRASDLWVQASLDYKQRLQQLFFPAGIAYDGSRFNRTDATAPLFNYLAPSESADEKMVSREGIVHVGEPEGRSRVADADAAKNPRTK